MDRRERSVRDGPPPELLAWMDATLRAITTAYPERVPESPANLLYGTTLAECVGLFMGVRRLVESKLVSPAMILNRALVENSITLAYIASNPATSDQLALRELWVKVNRELKIAQNAERIHAQDASSWRALLQEDLAMLREEARAIGLTNLTKKLPSVQDMARDVGAQHEIVGHGIDLLSLHVHTGRAALSGRIDEPAHAKSAGVFTPFESRSDRQVIAAEIATSALADAAAAVSALQQWPKAAELASLAAVVGDGWHES